METPAVQRLGLNSPVEALAAWLVNWLETVGAPLRGIAYDRITLANVVAALSVLLLVLILNALFASFLRRRVKKAEVDSATRDWRAQLIDAFGKPFYLLIWIFGIVLAALTLLTHYPAAEGIHPLRRLVDRLTDVGLFVFVIWVASRSTRLIENRLRRWSARSESHLDDLLVPYLGKTLRVFLPVLAIILALPLMGLPPAYDGFLGKASSLLIIGTVAYILFQSVGAAEQVLLARYDLHRADNLEARKIYTQVHVLSKALYVLIAIFTVASALMLFEEVRRLGTSIMASAGVVGIIIGFAAQRTIANLFAGFQLAMTQPIRMDDVVIVENEWGRIEEITLTYVVVRIWDERRLVVPLSYFIEKPFQNWTRVSADLLGSVFLYADYSLPLDALRQEIKRLVEGSPLWDRKFWNLQVTDTSEKAMQIRVLVTACDSGKAWDLRCELREKLLVFIQRNYPQSLPRFRADFDPGRLIESLAPPRSSELRDETRKEGEFASKALTTPSSGSQR